jgi:integrase
MHDDDHAPQDPDDPPALPPQPAGPPRPPEPWPTPAACAAVPLPPATLAPAEIAAARGYVEAARAASTQKAYAADWTHFSAWCRDRDADALPARPALVAIYLAALATNGQAPPSIARALAAIAHTHRRAGHVPPHRAEGGMVIAETLAGIRRSRTGGPDRKDAADADVVMRLLWSIEGTSLAALRDRALIAFGMALAARRSELVALDVADLAWEAQGLRVTIRRSKTDQEGDGAVVAVPEGRRLTPLTHLRAWLAAAKITEGPLFRPLWKGNRTRDARLSDHAVARIVQARALAAGLDPRRYAGHSLRAGFVTSAARAGADVWKIQQVSRHKSMQVLSGYVRDARLFDDHAGEPFL